MFQLSAFDVCHSEKVADLVVMTQNVIPLQARSAQIREGNAKSMGSVKEESDLVSVGIVTWNSAKDLPACIAGLREQSHSPIEFVVVDNASNDDSVSVVQELLPEAKLILNNSNEGYCRSQNVAIHASKGEYYLALNPDVRLMPTFIEHLVLALEEHPDCGSAVGKMWLAAEAKVKVLDGAGLFLDRRRHQFLRGHKEVDQGQFDRAQEVFGADGAAPLHRRAMLEDVKVFGEVFDEQFFGYQEDVDVAWRARLLGWKCWYQPRATAFHERTFKPGMRRSVPRQIRRIAVKNRYLTILKNEAPECWRRDWWRILAFDLGILTYILLFEQSSLGAFGLLRRQWPRARLWRAQIWDRVKAEPQQRLGWFG